MDERQVAGVVAHELAHIKHRDTLVMSIAATLSGAIGMLAQFGGMFAMRGRDGQRNSNPIAGLLLIILGPIAASIVLIFILQPLLFRYSRILWIRIEHQLNRAIHSGRDKDQ
jgi:heat shock protein HtpX